MGNKINKTSTGFERIGPQHEDVQGVDKFETTTKKQAYTSTIGIRKVRGRGTITHTEIYLSNTWRKLRAEKIKLNPLCEHCSIPNMPVIATVVDHILPVLVDKTKVYDIENTQSLCATCHSKKTRDDIKKYDHYSNYDIYYTDLDEPDAEITDYFA